MTSANITFLYESDLPDPEAKAMLGSFYSRSTYPIQERLSELKDESIIEIKKSLNKYAIGYGHKSILDLADSPLIFIEGISILGTKAIESSLLGNYQETSTRYINFSNQSWINPLKEYSQVSGDYIEFSEYILRSWIEKYNQLKPLIETILKTTFPRKDHQKEHIYLKAIKAKTFDIIRSLLPAGMKTNVALKMSFSSLKEHLNLLTEHPLKEIREITQRITTELHNKFPFSFPEKELPKITDAFDCDSELKSSFINSCFYNDTNISSHEYPFNINKLLVDSKEVMNRYEHSLTDSEKKILEFIKISKTKYCPNFLSKLGSVKIVFQLDYGSWRDLQRHRNVLYNKCSILQGPACNFLWDYFELVPNDDIDSYIDEFIFNQFKNIETLKAFTNISDIECQYFYPLGTMVKAELVCSVPELVYILELRSSKSVHFTLRNLVHRIYNILPQELKDIIHIDSSQSEFHFERGYSDITIKTD